MERSHTAAFGQKRPEAVGRITTNKSEQRMITPNQLRARKQYRTDNVSGEGTWCRVSRCLPVTTVRLFATAAECERVATLGKKCSQWGCRGVHSTEELEVVDAFPWAK
jgi:hypothetical protein